MSESKKRGSQRPRHSARSAAQKRLKRIDPRGPWKRSWWVLWGFITVIGELILIFLVRGQVVEPSVLQIAVIAICIPLVAHLLVSGLRTLLFLASR